LSLKAPERGKKNKTSLMFALKDKPGALHDALVPFKNYGINLMKIESRPTKRKAWEYVFFVDFAGHQSDPKAQKALKALKRCTAEVRVLGSYPVGSKS
ncbi:MAG: ACT domain-containing protein, partial [Candidatus Omnitrophota bacterium]|nr:ACT domain-containing protein [Candidatus Omnitrophota bacterium]